MKKLRLFLFLTLLVFFPLLMGQFSGGWYNLFDAFFIAKGDTLQIRAGKVLDGGDFTADKVKSKYVVWEGLNVQTTATIPAGGVANVYSGIKGLSDTIIIDSIRFIFSGVSATNPLDSLAIMRGYTRNGIDGTLLYGDGTDITTNTITKVVNIKISTDWRIRFYFVSAGASNSYVASIKIYAHYE